MPAGDEALIQGYPVVPESGEEGRVRWGAREINRTRDFIAQLKPPWNGYVIGTVGRADRLAFWYNNRRLVVRIDKTDRELAFDSDVARPAGGRPVGDISGAHAIGLRWGTNWPVIRVNENEYELAKMSDINGLDARLRAAGL